MGRYTETLRKRLRNPLPPALVGAIRQGVEKSALKGVFDGNCNRTACQRPIKGANWWNSSTRAYYCGYCANGHEGINHWSMRDEGIVICTAVTDPNDRPPFPSKPVTA